MNHFCDGSIKFSFYEDLSKGINEKRFYEYPTTSNCIGFSEEANLLIYPNPAANHISIQTTDFELNNVSLIIQDVYGRELFKKDFDYKTTMLTQDVSFLPKGTYFISINNGQIQVRETLVISR